MNGFLQEYGLNIVAVIIVLAFIVFASVFGDTITTGVSDITSDFFAKSGVTADINGGGGGAGGNGDANQENDGGSDKVNIISFTIDGVSYQAKEGMTWEEWIGSEYNTASTHFTEFRISSGGDESMYRIGDLTDDPVERFNYILSYRYGYSVENDVKTYDEITAGYQYVTQ